MCESHIHITVKRHQLWYFPAWVLSACFSLHLTDFFVSPQLSINGDKEFLDDAHKVNPYHLTPVIAVGVKQSEESQEAGPLPVKVDLNKTCI